MTQRDTNSTLPVIIIDADSTSEEIEDAIALAQDGEAEIVLVCTGPCEDFSGEEGLEPF